MQIRLFVGLLIVAAYSGVLVGQQATATDDETAVYRSLLRDRVLRWGAVVVQRETSSTSGYLQQFHPGQWKTPLELVRALLEATRTPGELSLTLGTEPGVTLLRGSEIGSCPLSGADVDALRARDPRPRLFMSPIGFSADRQEALVAVSNCGGGAVVWLRRAIDGWAPVSTVWAWDY